MLDPEASCTLWQTATVGLRALLGLRDLLRESCIPHEPWGVGSELSSSEPDADWRKGGAV